MEPHVSTESLRESPCLIPSERLEAMLDGLPRRPGVYLMKDAQGRVIYVGKAGVLRNRVRSYFRSQDDLGPKVRAMVARVADFEYIVTASEKEALLLESNLLKEHRPRYNIKLRDDKQYLYLKVGTGARFPRVYTTRRIAPDGARYFGPYTNAQALRGTIKQLQRLFQFRTCTLDMEKEYRRPCLLFHIKRCSGPCIREVTAGEYDEAVRHLILFLEGKHEEVLGRLRDEMAAAADALSFERAAALRDRIAAAQRVAERQRVTAVGRGDLDAIAFAAEDSEVAVQVFAVRDDKIVNREEFVLQDADGATSEEILTQFVQQYYDRATYVPPTVLLPHPVESPGAIEILAHRAPRRARPPPGAPAGPQTPAPRPRPAERGGGPRTPEAEVARRRAQDPGRRARAGRSPGHDRSPAPHRVLRHLAHPGHLRRRLDGRLRGRAARPPRLPPLPDQGGRPERRLRLDARGHLPALPPRPRPRRRRAPTQRRAGRRSGRPRRGRRIRPRRLSRRAHRGHPRGRRRSRDSSPQNAEDAEDAESESDGPAGARGGDRGGWTLLPDLVIIDGGKGQLGAALDAMRDVSAPPLATIGLAKEREEIFRPGYSEPLLLPRTSQALYLIQRVRDEAHRFAVTYHRLVRNKRMVGSKLDGVAGVGPKRKKALLQRFGSVSGIRDASDEELLAVPGINDSILAQLREQL